MKQRRCERVCRVGWSCRGIAALSVTALTAMPCLASGRVPSYDFNWATIGSVNNPAVPASFGELIAGRGSVGYEYRISKLEITTSQWMEFVNTYSVLGGTYTDFGRPIFWGAFPDGSYEGPGQRWLLPSSIPDAGQRPVGGITWREAAMYCNWLHNDKQPTLDAIADGAYDTSTFTRNPDGSFNDQPEHSAGAKFWIPTLDEWTKAAHYDPDRNGTGEGGWWTYPNTSDTALIGGVPGEGEANHGFTLPNFGEWRIPVGSYPETQSPWGLLDLVGSASKWIEGYYFPEPPEERIFDGSAAGFGGSPDHLNGFSSLRPDSRSPSHAFRVASAIPAPSAMLIGAIVLAQVAACRKRSKAGGIEVGCPTCHRSLL